MSSTTALQQNQNETIEFPNLEGKIPQEGIELLQEIWGRSPNKPLLEKFIKRLETQISERKSYLSRYHKWLDEDNREMAEFDHNNAMKATTEANEILQRLGLSGHVNKFLTN